MSQLPKPTIRVRGDPTNPGQFFACCGLLELADRFWRGAEGSFEGDGFSIRSCEDCSLSELLHNLKTSRLADHANGVTAEDAQGADDEDEAAGVQPLEVLFPDSFNSSHPLRLDWWTDRSLKPWAGSMNARVIYLAMRNAIDPSCLDPLNDTRVVFDPPDDKDKAKAKRAKKREPFYFDARRGASARSRDIGFAPDALKMTSIACPAVECLCLIGLQRFRPMPTNTARLFDYHTWSVPLEVHVASAAVCGLLPRVDGRGFRFENAFRTDQRKHKTFTPATPLSRRQR